MKLRKIKLTEAQIQSVSQKVHSPSICAYFEHDCTRCRLRHLPYGRCAEVLRHLVFVKEYTLPEVQAWCKEASDE